MSPATVTRTCSESAAKSDCHQAPLLLAAAGDPVALDIPVAMTYCASICSAWAGLCVPHGRDAHICALVPAFHNESRDWRAHLASLCRPTASSCREPAASAHAGALHRCKYAATSASDLQSGAENSGASPLQPCMSTRHKSRQVPRAMSTIHHLKYDNSSSLAHTRHTHTPRMHDLEVRKGAKAGLQLMHDTDCQPETPELHAQRTWPPCGSRMAHTPSRRRVVRALNAGVIRNWAAKGTPVGQE